MCTQRHLISDACHGGVRVITQVLACPPANHILIAVWIHPCPGISTYVCCVTINVCNVAMLHGARAQDD